MRRSPWLLAGVLFLLSVLPYVGTLGYGPLNWDDPEYVGLPWYREANAFLRIWTSFDTPQVYPVVFTSFWIDSVFWGGSMVAVRVTNLVLHATAAVLAFFLARHLLAHSLGVSHLRANAPEDPRSKSARRVSLRHIDLAAFLIALAYALHPTQVGSVAWIAERKNMLVAALSFGSILLYLRSRADGFDRKWAGSFALAVLAMLSKSSAVVLPLQIAIVGGLHANWRRNVPRIVPFFLLAALQSALTVFREHGPEVVSDESWLERIAIAGGAIWFNVSKLLLPLGLSPLYPRWKPSSVVLAGLLGLTAVGVIAWAFWRFRARIPGLVTVGLLFFVVSLLPTLGLIPFGYLEKSFVADHFLYVPAFGLWLAIAGVLFRWTVQGETAQAQQRRRIVATLTGTLLLAYAAMSFQRTRHWESSETYWTHVLTTNPDAWVAWNNRGEARLQEGRFDSARSDIEKALAIRPDYPEATFNLGFVREKQSNPAGAIEAYRSALELSPDFPDAHWNLGRLLLLSGRRDEGIRHLERAHALDPAFPLEQTLRAVGVRNDAGQRDGTTGR